MSHDKYKGEAKRLAAYLSQNHGVHLKHSSILEAIASVHGARSWNALLHSPQSLAGKAARWLAPPPPDKSTTLPAEELPYTTSPLGLNIGVHLDYSGDVVLKTADARKHLLVVAPRGKGAGVFVEHIVAQHMAKGGSAITMAPAMGESALLVVAREMREFALPVVARLPEVQTCAVDAGSASALVEQLLLTGGVLLANRLDPRPPTFQPSCARADTLLQTLMAALERQPRRDLPAPLMLVVDVSGLTDLAPLKRLVKSGRQWNLIVVLWAQSLECLRRHDTALGDAIMEDAFTKVLFRPATEADAYQLIDIFDLVQRAPDADARRTQLRQTLMELRTGETYLHNAHFSGKTLQRYLWAEPARG